MPGPGFNRRVMAICAVVMAAVFSRTSRGVAMEMTPQVSDLYSSVSIYPPSAGSMTICYGFICRRRQLFDFSSADKAALGKLLAAGKGSAAAERAAVQKAVAWWDRRVGPVIGTDKRIANADFRYFDDRHNFDCWDTTRNVTSLLLIMQDWGLLKHHTVGNPRYRGNALALQTPHNTAVLVDRTTGTDWVIDMWTRGYAQLPDVKPADQWVKEN